MHKSFHIGKLNMLKTEIANCKFVRSLDFLKKSTFLNYYTYNNYTKCCSSILFVYNSVSCRSVVPASESKPNPGACGFI